MRPFRAMFLLVSVSASHDETLSSLDLELFDRVAPRGELLRDPDSPNPPMGPGDVKAKIARLERVIESEKAEKLQGALESEKRHTQHSQAPPNNPTFIVLADPQLGLKNQYENNAYDWAAELDMFKGLVKAAAEQKPDFIFVAGDMQNYWPNEKNKNGSAIVGRSRGFGENAPGQSDEELMSGQLGRDQRAAVSDALQTACGKIPCHFTAGNHDIGDVPDSTTLAIYTSTWGKLWSDFTLDKTLYLQFTSQFYWNHSLNDPRPNVLGEDMQQQKALQNDWLEAMLKKMEDGVERLVLLTHIPPFMNTRGEKSGWANWNVDDREWILEKLDKYVSAKSVPVWWVCGHFHTNVEKEYTTAAQTKGNIVVTSSSGSTMWWDEANGDGHLSPAQAAAVATKPVPKAFFEDIILVEKQKMSEEQLKTYVVGQDLIQPIARRSGLRKFWIEDGTFLHKWMTLEELSPRLNRERGLGT